MAFIAPLAAAAGAGGLGTALGIGSSIIGGLAQYSDSKFQAQVAKNNAAIAAENASKAGDAEQQQLVDKGREDRAFLGQQIAAQGASGANVNSVSSVLTRKQTKDIFASEAVDIQTASQNNIRAYQQEQANALTEAREARRQGKIGLISTAFDVAGSFINSSAPKAKKASYVPKPTPRYRRPV